VTLVKEDIAKTAAQLLSLEGEVAMVTGAASGIGRAIAMLLARMGSAVALLDIDERGGNETLSQIQSSGGKALFIRCDVQLPADCAAATEKTLAAFGKITILCNNAGLVVRKSVVATSDEEWNKVLDVTLKGAYLLSRSVLPYMIRDHGGKIINTGSGWSLKGGPNAAAYCAAKAGVLNLTRAMAIDHGRHNIRVNCVCPGDIDTPMLRGECNQLGEDWTKFKAEAAARPLHSVGTPEDVAQAVLFLATRMSGWITGIALVVDGGGLA
jgi:NAD(P)-dependent dehydrogenase (short-subunit alcohol dehydrogenase family)